MRRVLLLMVLLVLPPAAAHAGVVYSNGFNGVSPTSAGFTGGTLTTSPNGKAQFLALGQHETATLSLAGLAAHSSVTVGFDVDVLLSMDGDGQYGGGRDQFLVTYAGSASGTLLDADYANYKGVTQDNGGQGTPIIPHGYPSLTGSDPALRNTFGYAYAGEASIDDSVYHYSLTVADTSPALAIAFTSNATELPANEFYGIDNVVVSTNSDAEAPLPEPASIVIGALGLAGIAAVHRRSG